MAPHLPIAFGEMKADDVPGAPASDETPQMPTGSINSDSPNDPEPNISEHESFYQLETQAQAGTNRAHDSHDVSVAEARESSSDHYDSHGSLTSPEIHAAEHRARIEQHKHDVAPDIAITAENAQSIFSPDACIFVANLDRARSRMELVDEITRVFQQVSECWVKVRHDGKTNIPVSFVQFRDVESADIAEKTMQGTDILGRPCRIERARAERTLFCYRKDMHPVSTPMVLSQLRAFGNLEHIWYPSHPEKAMYNLPDGIYVRFNLFQPCQEALKSLRNDPVHIFKLQETKPREVATPAILPEIKLHQIFVGDLSYYVSESELRVIFEAYGRVIDVYVKRDPIRGSAWSYVQFEDAWSAACAVQYPYPFVLGHRVARIEHRRLRGYPRTYPAPGYPYSGYPIFANRPGPYFTSGVRDYTWNSGPRCIPRGMPRPR